jgi:hypothetical protein
MKTYKASRRALFERLDKPALGSSTGEMRKRLEPLCLILDKYGVTWVAAESTDPGTIIYEDRFQVGVIPYQRFDPTPMPQGIVLGPTTAGSKRHLGKRARSGA